LALSQFQLIETLFRIGSQQLKHLASWKLMQIPLDQQIHGASKLK
jgi:hypothetical protein